MAVKASLVMLLLLVASLQYKVWFSDVGYLANTAMRDEVAQQRQRTDVLRQRNRILTAEVLALQRGLDAVEASARANLGMIKQGETFYLVNPD